MQCQAVTKNGEQCPNRARDGAPYCYDHEDYDPNNPPSDLGPACARPHKVTQSGGHLTRQCSALTLKGHRCSNKASNNSKFCRKHQK